MTALTTPESVVQRQLDAYNARDVDALMSTYADNVEQFEYPDTLICSGAAQLRERMAARLSDPHLHARLVHRTVMGQVVIDHEEVTRTFPDGTGKIMLVAIYEVRDGKISTARFIAGKVMLDSEAHQRQLCTINIGGIKGCFEKTRGLFYFARMCSKIRLHAQDKLPAEYHEMLGQGFDGRMCRYLRVRYEEVKARVLSGMSDTDVLDWCFANGRPLTDEEVLIYNSFMSKRGWHDDETDGFIPATIKQYGLPDNGTILTDFDLIEMDEGRWYPDMWREAWK